MNADDARATYRAWHEAGVPEETLTNFVRLHLKPALDAEKRETEQAELTRAGQAAAAGGQKPDRDAAMLAGILARIEKCRQEPRTQP